MSRFTIEGRVLGVWSRRHVGPGGETEANVFGSREAAEAALPGLARHLDCEEHELRVAELKGGGK